MLHGVVGKYLGWRFVFCRHDESVMVVATVDAKNTSGRAGKDKRRSESGPRASMVQGRMEFSYPPDHVLYGGNVREITLSQFCMCGWIRDFFDRPHIILILLALHKRPKEKPEMLISFQMSLVHAYSITGSK